jgi:hypothetical protein
MTYINITLLRALLIITRSPLLTRRINFQVESQRSTKKGANGSLVQQGRHLHKRKTILEKRSKTRILTYSVQLT